jgi:hypothetical protein
MSTKNLLMALSLFLILPFAHTRSEVRNNQGLQTHIYSKNTDCSDISPSQSMKNNSSLEKPSINKPKLLLSKKEMGREKRKADLKKVNNHLKRHGHKYVFGYLCGAAIVYQLYAVPCSPCGIALLS